jgi:hypothetical protein
MLMAKDSLSELEKIETRLADELVRLLESKRETKDDLEKLQIKLNMVHETQIQAAHLAYEDLKELKLVTAEELVKPGESKHPRHMRITFDEMPVVWPLGVKERFIRKMIEYDHSSGDYILSFFGKGVVEASGVKLILSKEDAQRACEAYVTHADALAEKLDLTVVQ